MAYHPVRTAHIMRSLLGCVLAWLVLFAASSLFSSAWAQNSPAPVQITDGFSQQNIGLHLSIMEDPSRQLTLEDVRSAEVVKRFTPSSKANPNFGYTNSAYWATFALADMRSDLNRTTAPWYLTIAYAITDEAALWCSDANNTIVIAQRAGDHISRSEWPNSHREPTFEIPTTARECWLQVKSTASLQIPLQLRTQDAFVNMRLSDNALQALYFGALLVMLVYNAIIAINIRSLAYAAYCTFLLSYALFQCAFSGYGYTLLWVDAIGWANKAVPFFVACTGVTSVLFAITLLEIRENERAWFRFGIIIASLFSLSISLPWLIEYSVVLKSIFLLYPIWGIFLIGAGIKMAIKGSQVAKIFLLAWFIFVAGAIITMLSALGWIPSNGITTNASQIGSALEFVLLSVALSNRIKTLQQRLLESVRAESAAQTQALQAQALASQAQNEAKLAKAEQDAQQAQHSALALQTEMARKEAEHAQNQLQQADKMASLGQLVASVTHEINTPIGAISSSGQSMSEALTDVVSQLPPLLKQLDDTTSTLLIDLLLLANQPKPPLSSREERALIKKVTEQLDAAGLEQARQKAGFLVSFHAHQELDKYLPLLQHPQSEAIEQAARSVASAMGNARNVNVAVERVTKLVKALKSFSHFNIGTEKIDANLVEGMETVLTIYQGQTKVGVEVVRNYEDIPLLNCFPDELNQVWTNLIHNALQAMNHEGTLTIGIREENGHAVVSVGDSGCGIPEEIRGKIFDVFFTTKPAGVGSGLGLDIVKKIIDKHHGRIELQSEVGVGTTFTVMLPYHYEEPQESLQD
jgi:signal transduction histidine kinase